MAGRLENYQFGNCTTFKTTEEKKVINKDEAIFLSKPAFFKKNLKQWNSANISTSPGFLGQQNQFPLTELFLGRIVLFRLLMWHEVNDT